MFKHRFLIGFSALSIATFAMAPLTYAREAQPGDDRGHGRHEIERNDDRGDGHHEVEINDDRGQDRLVEVQAGDDRGVDPAPHE